MIACPPVKSHHSGSRPRREAPGQARRDHERVLFGGRLRLRRSCPDGVPLPLGSAVPVAYDRPNPSPNASTHARAHHTSEPGAIAPGLAVPLRWKLESLLQLRRLQLRLPPRVLRGGGQWREGFL